MKTLLTICALTVGVMSSNAMADIKVPKVCAKCRYEISDQSFLRCLDVCLNAANTRPEYNPSGDKGEMLQEALWDGWVFNKEKTFTWKKSDTVYTDPFGREFRAILTLSPHHGQKGVKLEVPPFTFGGLRPEVQFKVDNYPTMKLEGNRYSSSQAFWTADFDLLRLLRKGDKLTVKFDTFGDGTRSYTFDLDGIKDAMGVIWN